MEESINESINETMDLVFGMFRENSSKVSEKKEVEAGWGSVRLFFDMVKTINPVPSGDISASEAEPVIFPQPEAEYLAEDPVSDLSSPVVATVFAATLEPEPTDDLKLNIVCKTHVSDATQKGIQKPLNEESVIIPSLHSETANIVRREFPAETSTSPQRHASPPTSDYQQTPQNSTTNADVEQERDVQESPFAVSEYRADSAPKLKKPKDRVSSSGIFRKLGLVAILGCGIGVIKKQRRQRSS